MKKISPANVQRIQQWVQEHYPDVDIELTGYDKDLGADGVYFETEDLNIDQALELLELRADLSVPISLANTGKLQQVAFTALYPGTVPNTPHTQLP